MYCTMLAQAQSASERTKIEEKMSADAELSQYLRALQATEKDDVMQDDRQRSASSRHSRAEEEDMDTSDTGVRTLDF